MQIKQFIKQNSISSEQDLFNYLDSHKFGWGLVIDGIKNSKIGPQVYSEIWKLKDVENIIEDEIAICRDYANFEKLVFDELGIMSSVYYMVFGDDIVNNPAHSFNLINRDNEVILVEYSFRQRAGIYYYDNEETAIIEMTDWLFQKFEYLRGKGVKVYRFDSALPRNISAKELYNLAIKQELVYNALPN